MRLNRRKMKFYRKKYSMILTFTFILMMFSIGYAVLSTTLSVNGTSKMANATWNVHFDNIVTKTGSVTPTTAPTISNNTTVSFAATLADPGDFYEFNIDVVNSGSIDAMIDTITLTPTLTAEQLNYFNYSVTYIDGVALAENQLLEHGTTQTLKIRFEYLENDNIDLYPEEDQNFSFSFTTDYVQKGTDAINILSYNRLKEVPGYVQKTDSFLGGPINREEIESIAFVNNNTVDNNAIGSFDVSENNNGSILAWYTDTDSDGLYEVKIGSSDGLVLTNTNSQFLFMNCINVENFDFSYFSTRGTTSMAAMFSSLYVDVNTGTPTAEVMKISTLDLSHFDTSLVEDMNDFLRGCHNLTTVDISSFKTNNVKDMSGMFAAAAVNLTGNPTDSQVMHLSNIIGISSINTSSVEGYGFYGMFNGCAYIESLDLRNFDTSKATNIGYMFAVCLRLKNLNLYGFNTANVTGMYGLFNACIALQNLDISTFVTSNVTDMGRMFSDCMALSSISVGHFNTSKVTNMTYMFRGCRSLTSLDLSNFDFSKVTNLTYAFAELRTITVNVSGSSFKSTVNLNYITNNSTSVTMIVKTATDKTLLDNKGYSNLTVQVA